jgi:hypothetical protein
MLVDELAGKRAMAKPIFAQSLRGQALNFGIPDTDR